MLTLISHGRVTHDVHVGLRKADAVDTVGRLIVAGVGDRGVGHACHRGVLVVVVMG